MGMMIVRLVVLAATTAAGFALGPPLGLSDRNVWLGAAGLLVGALAVLLEWHARRVPVDRLFWGAAGGLLGVAFGLGLGSALGAVVPGAGGLGRGIFALLAAYLGAAVALAKRDELEAMSEKLFPRRVGHAGADKVLDTSAIIDGRIASVCESGFLEGTLVVPQFVLHELQQIADSSDALRRTRAKRGFEVLQRLQRMDKISVRIEARDFPAVRDVDQKLLELAKATGGKIVTNDYTLNKLAEVTGVAVLNVNELAGALRPVFVPGELMQVYVVKEGKEAGQGVGYLDDGTMVVVDHGKRYIGQTVDAAVTTVLQTAAGRMVFARLREEESGQR